MRDFARTVLETFIEERRQRFPARPDLLPFFRLGRAHLAIAHDQCEVFLRLLHSKDNGPFFGCIHSALHRSPVRYTQRFFCILQLIYAKCHFLRSSPQLQAWLFLISEGACDIYGQSYDLFLRLESEESEWQAHEPASNNDERSLRFTLCALMDLVREFNCDLPHPEVIAVTVRVLDELIDGSVKELDEQGILNVGEHLVRSSWGAR